MKLRPLAPALVLAALVGPSTAHAQGFGWGWGGLAMPWVPTPTNTVESFALQNAARAGRPASNNVYANNPNSYVNRLRDNGLVQQMDARGPSAGSRRAAALANRSLGAAPAAGPRPEPSPAEARPSRPLPAPLASFFNAAGVLVWPSDSPDHDDLKTKRDTSDRATGAVHREVESHGFSSIAMAAEARQKLLDYGRPALQEIRATSSPAVADGFHEFLLSLYDALAAATIPSAPSE